MVIDAGAALHRLKYTRRHLAKSTQGSGVSSAKTTQGSGVSTKNARNAGYNAV
jgi:hypothetical protein